MNKIKVMAVVENDDLRFEMKSNLMDDEIAFLGFSKSGEAALEKALSLKPDVVLLAYENEESLDIAQKIYVSLPGCAVILMCEEIDISIVNKAMTAGIRKVIELKSSSQELVDSIQIGFSMESARFINSSSKQINTQARIISVFGPKGGIGKTTISANLAVAIAKKGKKVAVLDLNLQFGDLNLFFDIQPKDTIAELVQEKQSFDIDTIKSFMMLHSSGVSILCAPKSPELAEIVTAEHIEKIINTLRPYYDYIIIDTAPIFNDSSIAAIENANLVLMIVTLEISTLRNAKISLDIFESLQQKEKIQILVNRNAPSLISVKDTQSILDMSVKYKVSSDWKTAISSLNKGVPLVIDAPRSTIGHELTVLGSMVMNYMDVKDR